MAKAVAKDVFMQFAGIARLLDAADSSALVFQVLETGLSIRGGLAWLIHQVQFSFGEDALDSSVSLTLELSLATKAGATWVPRLNETGVIAHTAYHHAIFGAAAGSAIVDPPPQYFTPPIPLAAPRLYLYGATTTNQVAARADEIAVRVGYTTVPLDAALWQEIAETWGW